MSEELVEKVALAIYPKPRDPSTPTEREIWATLLNPEAKFKARAVIQAFLDAGWRPPEKPKLLNDVS